MANTENQKETSKFKNSRRFINCYNSIDAALRNQNDYRHGMSYTEAVHKAARTNSIVRKYEDVLVDYGRLRNAIVHTSNDDFVIAEPHDSVVEEYEKIANLICTPPTALSTVGNKVLSCIEYDVKLKDVIEYSYKSGFSNIPIFKNGMLIGLINSPKLVEVIGKKIYEKVDINAYLAETDIETVIKEELSNDNYYTIGNKDISLDKVLNMFTENRKLLCVLITPTGSLLEEPLGIITISDIMDINKVLDNYK